MMNEQNEAFIEENNENKRRESCSCIKRDLIPLKFIFFFYMSCQGTVVNYRSLFTKHLGLSTTQTGIIWAIDRVLGIFSPPLLGALSDKTRRPRDVIAIIFVVSGIVLSSVVFLPRQHPLIDVTCEDTNLYPLDTNSLEQTNSTEACYQLMIDQTSHILCASSGQTSIDEQVWMRSLNESFSILRQITHHCTPQQNSSSFFIEKTSHYRSDVYTCADDNCDVIPSDDVSYVSGTDAVMSACICVSEQESSSEYDKTFWIFLFMNLAISLGVLSSQGLVDAFVINQLPSNKRHHFGYQRLWGSIGFGACTLMGGYFKDTIIENFPDLADTNIPFMPIFQLSGLMCFLLSITVKCTPERKGENGEIQDKFRFSSVKTLLCDMKILMFFIFTSAVGFSLGVGENYAFVLAVEKVDASGTILGLSIALSSIFDVIMYLASTKLLKKFGTNRVMIIGLQVLSIKLLLYTFCTEGWNFILVEQIRGLSWGITWTAVCNHATKLAPPGLNATMMGIVSMGAWGLGYGLASLVGGILYDSLGGDRMFRVCFLASTTICVIYATFVFCTEGRNKQKILQLNTKEDNKIIEIQTTDEEDENKNIEDLNNNV